ncbi:FAT-like protein, partial [Mya arenaria]
TISTSGTLDRETIARYTLNVTANDGLQTSHCMVRINVNDVNDNAPKFDQSFYSFDIPEDTAIGTTVGSVRADDLDVGLNGDVLYSLTAGWGNDTFELDPVKGTFKLLRVLDFEETWDFVLMLWNSLYTLQVLAYDAGTEPQTSSILVFFNVKDTNDHIPEFEQGEYNAAVYENVTIGTSVLQVEALDIDS